MFASLFPVAGNLHADSGQADNVLVLHSYHQGNAWCDNVNSGIDAVFEESEHYIELYVEYMDTKRQVPEEVFPYLAELFKFKYTDSQFDVIISTDNNALDFLLEYGADLFPGVPIIFCGVNNYNDEMIEGFSGITGVAEDFDLRATLELALQLFPDTNNVAVISDGTESGRINNGRMLEIVPEFEDRIDFIWLNDRTAEELVAELNSLPGDTLVFYANFFRDRMGISYTVEEGNTLIVNNTDFPVLTSWDIFIEYGFLGGIVTSGRLQGENAAQMAHRILDGESSEDIPVLRDSPNVPMFDYNAMTRYGISTEDLPEGSIILNQPVSYYSRYRSYIRGLVVFIILLVALIAIMGTNIAQRRLAVRALKKSEEKYRHLLSSLHEGIWAIDENNVTIHVNPRTADMLGYEVDEIVGRPLFDFMYEKDVEFVKQKLEGRKQGIKEEYEFEFPRKDGSRINVMVSTAPILDDGGNYIGSIAMILDITDRKQAEEALRKSEEKYRSIFDSALVGLFRTRLSDGKILEINDRFIEMVGYSNREDIMNKGFAKNLYYNPEDREQFKELIEKSGEVTNFEIQGRRQNGEIIWVRLDARLYREEGYTEGVITDITDRKQAEEALQQSEGRFRELFDNMSDGVAVYEAVDDGRDFVFVDFNQGGQKIEKTNKDKVIGRKVTEVFPGVKELGLLDVFQRVWKTGTPEHHQASLYKDNRNIIWRENYVYKLPTGEIVAIYDDVTEKKQAEEEILNKKIALEDALKIKNEFLSMVSHELRTPLVPIIGYSDLLLDRSFGEISNEAEDAIYSIKNRANDLVKLIEDLLMVSQLDRDKLQVDLKILEVNERLRDIISDFQSTDYGKPVKIELSGEEFNVTADPTRFRQVMQNLIGNAIKYSGDNVEIKVETRTDNNFGIITVKDNGIGIASEHQTKIFERFYQAEDINTRKHSGSGLGLAITRDLVELMDGEITVESEPGEGSIFTVKLPLG